MPIAYSLAAVIDHDEKKIKGKLTVSLQGEGENTFKLGFLANYYPDDSVELEAPTGEQYDEKTFVLEIQDFNGEYFFDADYSAFPEGYFVISAYMENEFGDLSFSSEGDADILLEIKAPLSSGKKGFLYSATNDPDPVDEGEEVYTEGEIIEGNYSLTLENLAPYTEYYIRPFVEIGGEITFGDLESFKTSLASPQTITASPLEEANQIVFSDVEHAQGYNLYWSTELNVTLESNKIEDVDSPFIHSGLVAGQRYYYRVSAFADGDESELSYEVTAMASEGFYIPPEFSPQNWRETEDYILLLTSQYQLAEKFKQWLRTHIELLKDGANIATGMNNAFDIDMAFGAQLDILGKIVGIDRVLPFEPSDGSSPVLSDSVYRQLIKATIARNHWDGKIESIEKAWRDIFPNSMILIQDNQDMSLNVSVLGEISELIQDLIMNDMLIPRPQAVFINYEWSPKPTKIFAYDLDSEEYGGYDIGRWSTDILE